MHSKIDIGVQRRNSQLVKRTIDDLPVVQVSAFVAHGHIARGAVTALIRFGDDGIEYEVGVRMKQFPNGGFWARFVCPRCDGGSQRLRLLDGQPACGRCLRASRLIYRSQSVRTENRHMVTAPSRIALLNGDKPARVNPRPGRRLDRRAPIEAALKRSFIVARRRAIAEFERKLIDP
jgi:hypothetical protein